MAWPFSSLLGMGTMDATEGGVNSWLSRLGISQPIVEIEVKSLPPPTITSHKIKNWENGIKMIN